MSKAKFLIGATLVCGTTLPVIKVTDLMGIMPQIP